MTNQAPPLDLPKDVLDARAMLEERLGYQFQNRALFDEALTHPSAIIRTLNNPSYLHNQRLEFLGDRVIGLIIADILFASTGREREGHLTRRYADCVENARLAKIARSLNIGAALLVQQGTALADTDKVLADALEAIIGGVWRDGGMEGARQVVLKIWGSLITENSTDEKDFKTQLQEHAHRAHIPPPEYMVINRQGLDHALVFTVAVACGGRGACATGTSHRQAEQNAAENWLKDMAK